MTGSNSNPLFLCWTLLVSWIKSLWERYFGPVLTLDSGIQCRIGRQIAEGGFSVVFRATPVGGSNGTNHGNNHNTSTVYALKRIQCLDREIRSACLRESKVHYAVMKKKEESDITYNMPLLGMTFEGENKSICYMLFPFYPHSLRQEVNQRILDPLQELDQSRRQPPFTQSQRTQKVKDLLTFQPWNESIVLQMFHHLCHAVQQLHAAGYTHRDIKLENILLKGSNTTHLTQPVLMDFGSAGPLTRSLSTKRDVLDVAEQASQHSTISYRPPELFSGELRQSSNIAEDETLDYTKCDVWMLGCVLFATLYGASPSECEFSRSTGQFRIVECTHNKVLGPIPKPPADTPTARWYSPQIKELVEWILNQDRHQRPTLAQVQLRVQSLLEQRNDEVRHMSPLEMDGIPNFAIPRAGSVDSGGLDIEEQVIVHYSTKSVLE
ncbi:protein kinase domain containing protein [Nitzschia inconspicua]|uniref:non-specific serine/threonine protein kinase n=1 Tax=Nitzschia inconspicua TaxID=303405 RepID=A0A9K3LSY2_9STRA|nr:protein kinase domain containing protein [Nitzschia inconspicua]